jgi:hypothetical protein
MKNTNENKLLILQNFVIKMPQITGGMIDGINLKMLFQK